MVYAIFYVRRPEGGHLAVCESFNGWNHWIDGELTQDAMQAAEESLRYWVAKKLRFVGYIVPHENQRLAEKLTEAA